MYLPIDEGFAAHRKTIRFCGLMQDHNAFAYLLRLWSWAVRSAPDGNLSFLGPNDIEIAIQYRLADGKCYAAMVKAGFIDESEPGCPLEIHNWMERTGAAIAKMETAAEASRQRKRRWRNGEAPKETTPPVVAEAGRNAGQDGSEQAENAHRQGKSKQGKSKQGKYSDPDLPPPAFVADLGQAGARSNGNAKPPIVYRPNPRVLVAAVTPAFLAVYDAYPNRTGKQESAQVFAELAEDYPGGEKALSAAILAAFAGGMLKRHPYSSPDPAYRTSLEKFLKGRRWEDAPPSVVDVAKPAFARSEYPERA